MKLHQLKALVAVADHGSIIGAARALFLSQPAVTKAVRELEIDVGLLLFARNSNGVTLTRAGESLLPRARLIIGELARAEEHMAAERGAHEGQVVMGVTPISALTVLPVAYGQFRQQMPSVSVKFLEQTHLKLRDNLCQGTLDFALGTLADPIVDSSIRTIELATIPLSFAVRQNGLLAQAKSLEDLCDAEWLHFDTTLAYPAYVAQLFNERGLPAPRRMTLCTSQSLIYSLAIQVDAVITWSVLALGSEAVRGQFHRLDFIDVSRHLKLMLMHREGSILTRPAQQLIDCIMQAAREELVMR